MGGTLRVGRNDGKSSMPAENDPDLKSEFLFAGKIVLKGTLGTIGTERLHSPWH
jgi:hypothetical protein